jgi:hypothetical protein
MGVASRRLHFGVMKGRVLPGLFQTDHFVLKKRPLDCQQKTSQ